jgi:hypothetical protein
VQHNCMDRSSSAQDPDGLPARWTHTTDTRPSAAVDRGTSASGGQCGHESCMEGGSSGSSPAPYAYGRSFSGWRRDGVYFPVTVHTVVPS